MLARFGSRLRRCFTAGWQRAIRSRALSAELRRQLALGRGERILAAGQHPDAGYTLIATDRALHHRDHRAGGNGWSRLGWELITGADWDSNAGRLVVTGLAGVAPPRTILPLRSRGTVPELAEERITHTRLGCWKIMLDGRRPIVVEVRRRPHSDELLWALVAGDGAGDGAGGRHIRAQVDKAVTQLGEYLGVTRPPEHGLLIPPLAQPRRGEPG